VHALANLLETELRAQTDEGVARHAPPFQVGSAHRADLGSFVSLEVSRWKVPMSRPGLVRAPEQQDAIVLRDQEPGADLRLFVMDELTSTAGTPLDPIDSADWCEVGVAPRAETPISLAD